MEPSKERLMVNMSKESRSVSICTDNVVVWPMPEDEEQEWDRKVSITSFLSPAINFARRLSLKITGYRGILSLSMVIFQYFQFQDLNQNCKRTRRTRKLTIEEYQLCETNEKPNNEDEVKKKAAEKLSNETLSWLWNTLYVKIESLASLLGIFAMNVESNEDSKQKGILNFLISNNLISLRFKLHSCNFLADS